MKPLNEDDKQINHYVKDEAAFVEVWEFEDTNGNTYRICQDQDGGEWVEE